MIPLDNTNLLWYNIITVKDRFKSLKPKGIKIMTIFVTISLVIIAALFSAKGSLKGNDHPTATGILTAPIFLGVKYLVTWGSFALVNLFTPLAYTPQIIVAFAAITGIINLFVEVIALYIEEKVN